MAETKSINFDHYKGFIQGNGECIGYRRSGDEWQPITSKLYKILDGKCPSELNEWSSVVSAYKAGDVVKYGDTAYYCLHDNIPSLHQVSNNPKMWRDYSYSFKDIKNGDLLITYAKYFNRAKNSETLTRGWVANSAIITKEADYQILGVSPWRIQSDASSSAVEHSFGQQHYFKENERICLSAYVQQNVSRTVGLGFKILNEASHTTYIAKFDIQTGMSVDISAYDENLNKIDDPSLLLDVTAAIQVVDIETFTYRISIFGTTTRENYLDCKIFLLSDAPDYDVRFVSSLLTGFHTINSNFIQIEKTESSKPSAYIAASDKPVQGYAPRGLFQKNGKSFTDYKELTAKVIFSQSLDDVRDAVDGDYAFVGNGLYLPQGAYLGSLTGTQEEIEPLMYRNESDGTYTISANTGTYRLSQKPVVEPNPSLINELTFNKHGFKRYCGYFKVC